MGVAPLAPDLPPFGLVLLVGVVIGLSYAYRYTLGALIVALANALNSVTLPGWIGGAHIFHWAAKELDALDADILNAFGTAISALEHALNYTLHFAASSTTWLARETAELAADTYAGFEAGYRTIVPHWVRKRLIPALVRLGVLGEAIDALQNVHIPSLHHTITIIKRETLPVQYIVKTAYVHTIPRTIPKIGGIERDISDLKNRLKHLGESLVPAVILGALIAALSQVGAGSVRCAKVNRWNKGLCGINEGLLDALLAELAILVVGGSLIEFAKALQPFTHDIGAASMQFWRLTVPKQATDVPALPAGATAPWQLTGPQA